MSQKNKTQLQQTNNTNFPNNNSAFITPEKLRDFNQDIIDSVALDVDTELSGAVTLEGSLSASGDISGSSFYGDGSNLTGITSQVPAGTVSGSSQVILTDTTGNLGGNRITGSVLNADTASYSTFAVTAGNASTADSVDYTDITNKPTLVSGSSQVSFNGITDKPTLVSGSSQISYPDISNIPSGIVSSSTQISNYGVFAELGGDNLVSSSAQVSDLTASLLDDATSDFSIITFTNGDGSTFEVDVTPRRVIETVKNKNGFMPKGTPVYVSGSTGNELHVFQADASNPNRVPATFILDQDLDTDESGIGILSGFINGVDTSLFAEGVSIYLAPGGGYTDTKPTGSAFIQKLGNVIKSDVNGSGVIVGAGRVNDLPNLTQGNIWVGDSNGVPQSYSTSSLNLALTDADNNFGGTQTFNNINVNGTGSFAYIESVTGSAKIIGDAFIILNNNTPTERYAGIAVQDSGSAGVTASFQFDGLNNDWFYEYSDDGGVTTEHGIALFGPEYSDISNPTYLTNNTIPKSTGGHHLYDSNITDNGTLVYVNSNFQALGDVDSISGIYNGINLGQFKSDFDTLSAKTLVSGSSQLQGDYDLRYAQLNSNNSFTGTQEITGSLIVSGSGANNQWFTDWPANFVQKNITTFGGLTTAEGDVYNNNFQNITNYGSFGAGLEGLVTSFNDSAAFNYGTSYWFGPRTAYWLMTPNGASQDSTIKLEKDSGASTTTITLQSDTINVTGTTSINSDIYLNNNSQFIGTAQFDNTSTFNGGITINGKVQTEVTTQAIVTNTATIDFSDTSLFVLTLDAGVTTTIDATNVGTGQTVNVLVKQNATTAGSVGFSSLFLQPSGSEYIPTDTLGGQDILTLMTFDDVNSIYVVATNKFI